MPLLISHFSALLLPGKLSSPSTLDCCLACCVWGGESTLSLETFSTNDKRNGVKTERKSKSKGWLVVYKELSSPLALRNLQTRVVWPVVYREHAPSIIFMDEVDSIGSARSDSGGGGGGDSEVQRTMLELLNQLDGFEATNKIKVGPTLAERDGKAS